jgi:hypothetical protein
LRACEPTSTPASTARSIEKRDGVLEAVDREMAVVEVDHRDARAHEPREGEHRHAGAERGERE